MKREFGQLYIVATPIGNLEDMSHRAITILSGVNLIAAEDTRHSKKLLNHFGIKTPILSLHSHNEKDRIQLLLSYLYNGKKIALISDAGTPLISDPGYKLVHRAHQEGVTVIPIPGPCALITALSASGLPAHRFVFEGFLPVNKSARSARLQALKHEIRTWVVYESPHRILDLFEDLQSILSKDRYIVIGKELTKLFETIKAGTVSEIYSFLSENNNHQKGEFVVIVQGAEEESSSNIREENIRLLRILLAELPLSQAVKLAAKMTGENKNFLYDIAVDL